MIAKNLSHHIRIARLRTINQYATRTFSSSRL
jgi:hypothetical protein